MKCYSLNEARQLAINCVQQYEVHLLNKKLLIIYRDKTSNQIEFLEVLFLKKNYQHLTGLELIDSKGKVIKHQSKNFYRKCKEKKLSNKEIKFKKDGTTNLKLAALPAISRVNSITKIIGDYNGKRPYLVVDKVIGGVNFCMGLKKVEDGYAPASALLENIKNLTEEPSQVLAIFIKEKDETIYKTIKHVAKGLNLNKITLPDKLLKIVSLEEYIEK